MTSSARDGRTLQLGTQRDKGSSSSSGDRFSVWLQIATDFPDARWIQASVGVHLDTSSRVGGALSLTPGDDQDGRWGDNLSPGSLGFGFGFASGDTKPFTFWHHEHLTSIHILGRISIRIGMYPIMTSCVRRGTTNRGPVVRLDCGEGQTEGATWSPTLQQGAHSALGARGPWRRDCSRG